MQFTDLASIEKFLMRELGNDLGNNDQLQKPIGKVVSSKVSDSVQSEVYSKYPRPRFYERRGLNGGLADPDNVERVSFEIGSNAIKLVYENTTEGADTLKGESLTEVIEEGIKDAWANPNGVWSEPRPFIEPAIKDLKESNLLRKELVNVLKDAGFEVK